MKKMISILLFTLSALPLTAMEVGYFINPVIRGDVADPSVIRFEGRYYATGTSSEWAPHYPVFESKDLVNWKQTGHIFNKKPAWTTNSFWAPELFVHPSGRVFCYYTARQAGSNIS
jgi:beta-xylosidase